MKTGIFTTSRAAREGWLAQRPNVERRYRPALAAMERAFEKSGADDPEVVVKAVVAALSVAERSQEPWSAKARARS